MSPSLQSPGPGRHRGATSGSSTLLRGLRTQVGPRSALRATGIAATTLGVATAFTGPAVTPELELTAAPHHAPARAAAEPVAAPEQVATYGVVGFTAKPRPRPRPATVPRTATVKGASSERTVPRVSRSASYSRSGLGALAGMSGNAVAVVNEVHASFPALRDIGGYRPGDPGDHGSGHAVDVMCGSADGDALAAHLQGMAGTLGITYLIWKQRIWYPGGGWRPMEDRGSVTANHYDHVHVSVR